MSDLPAVPDPGTFPVCAVPTPALVFTLGYLVARPEHAHRRYGGIAAIADELSSRARPRPGSTIPTTEYAALCASLPRDVAAAVEVLYRADRGQRMARGTSRPTQTGKS